MAHNLFGTRYGGRQAAWHGLGTVFETALTAIEAMERAGLDFVIDKLPLHVEAGGVKITLPDRYALVRRPTLDAPDYETLSVVGEDYEVIQNRDLAEILDRLTERWPVETVGALGKGETVFFCLFAGESEILGERYSNFFLVTDTRDGKSSFRIAFTPIRVVCQNTLNLGLKQASVNVPLAHSRGLRAGFEARIDMVAAMQQSEKMTTKAIEQLASVVLKGSEVDGLLKRIVPEPNLPKKAAIMEIARDTGNVLLMDQAQRATEVHDYYVGRAEGMRDGIKARYQKFVDEFPRFGDTGYAVVQAVAEWADHDGGKSNFSRQQSTLFGDRARLKARAYTEVLKWGDR